MRENVLLKIYGHLWPADRELLHALEALSGQILGRADSDIPLFELEGDLVRISFEGSFFPVDEVLEVIRRHLNTASKGKLDVLDLDAWTLTRHVFAGEGVTTSSASLNHVLDYSGH